ncbi:MAG TPA: phenylalanine--tRNA ligase subunit beta [Candidatus Norongarragalinales archaeon]|jgi:phenylalanyl-tRNA synthetase beta chain|nr:phenylalanine--tRNA ligase subunit beta [Candidatus Norongarragalinales archaeon]
MVKVVLSKKRLLKSLDKLSDEQLREYLPQIKCGVEAINENEIEVEITSDRPDLLSTDGIARALNGWLGKHVGLPKMNIKPPETLIEVEESVAGIRPIIVGAVVHGIKLSDDDLVDLMQQQERLHQTHGRRRKKVAIGVHDTDKVKGPFTYKAITPKSVKFVPLGWKHALSLEEILLTHEKGKDYAWVLEGLHKYPLLVDKHDEVLSFPPIINGALTTVTKGTQNLFIDVTGTDFDACNTALNILCQDFSDRGAFVHGVTVKSPKATVVTPVTEPQKMRVSATQINRLVGVKLYANDYAELLKHQRLGTEQKDDFIDVKIPRYRADFLHPIDIVEEAAIAYGLNKIAIREPDVFTKGSKSELTYALNSFRDNLANAGFIELNTPILTSEELLRKCKVQKEPVKLSNPISTDFGVVRPVLWPGLLDVLSKNMHQPYPQKIFEVSETVTRDEKQDNKTRTEYHISGVSCHANASLTEIASVMNEVLRRKFGVELEKLSHPALLEGRSAKVMLNGNNSGMVGEVHPEILEAFGLELPCALFDVVVASVTE